MIDYDSPLYPKSSDKGFPGITAYEKSLCCNCFYVPSLDIYFVGHWECRPIVPFIVSIVALSSYSVSLYSVVVYPSFALILSVIFSGILLFLFLFSYIRVITDGPGYFPFYWPEQIHAADPNSLDGIASSQDQVEYARAHVHPSRTIFSRLARRVVIRPDHFCGWTSSWIGKRNHKFFILFCSYASLYILSFFMIDSYAAVKAFSFDVSLYFIILLVFIVTAISFFFFVGMFAISQIQGMLHNTTSWEVWNHIDPKKFDKGFLSNVEDICGPKWACWICPVSPWNGMANDDLIKGYPSYIADYKIEGSSTP